jgi:RHS repeat-associated protein
MGVVGLSGTTATTGTATPVGYAGAYAEPGTGLIYLINRYYDPATAQFLSVDPAVALTQQPYSYAGDDPVNEVDPNGLSGGAPLSGECEWAGGRWVPTGIGQGNCVGKVQPHSVVAEAGSAISGAAHAVGQELSTALGTGNALAHIVAGAAIVIGTDTGLSLGIGAAGFFGGPEASAILIEAIESSALGYLFLAVNAFGLALDSPGGT